MKNRKQLSKPADNGKMKKMPLFRYLIIATALLAAVPHPVYAQLNAKEETRREKDFVPDVRNGMALGEEGWYFKTSVTVSYISMGPEVERSLGQVESFFNGGRVRFSLLNFSPEFTMKSDEKIKRAATNFLPTSSTCFGFISGRHQFEADIGLAGMLPINTIDADTYMTLKEDISGDPDDRPMANLGFVDPDTGTGRYSLMTVMNEEVWILNPSLCYDYIISSGETGRFSAGGSLGLLIVSATQSIRFKFSRIDYDGETYSKRVIAGNAMSTSINDVGPIARIFGSYRISLWGLMSELRAGVHYGFVDMHRHVDGSGTMYMGGDVMPVSYSTSSMTVDGRSIKNEETTRLEMAGFFIQIGMVF